MLTLNFTIESYTTQKKYLVLFVRKIYFPFYIFTKMLFSKFSLNLQRIQGMRWYRLFMFLYITNTNPRVNVVST